VAPCLYSGDRRCRINPCRDFYENTPGEITKNALVEIEILQKTPFPRFRCFKAGGIGGQKNNNSTSFQPHLHQMNSPTTLEQSSESLFTPEPGDTALSIKSLSDLQSIIRRYPPCCSRSHLAANDMEDQCTSSSTKNSHQPSHTRTWYSSIQSEQNISGIVTCLPIIKVSV
jgi:hypothetical protein